MRRPPSFSSRSQTARSRWGTVGQAAQMARSRLGASGAGGTNGTQQVGARGAGQGGAGQGRAGWGGPASAGFCRWLSGWSSGRDWGYRPAWCGRLLRTLLRSAARPPALLPACLPATRLPACLQGRYSFVGATPALEIVARGQQVHVLDHRKGTRQSMQVEDPMQASRAAAAAAAAVAAAAAAAPAASAGGRCSLGLRLSPGRQACPP